MPITGPKEIVTPGFVLVTDDNRLVRSWDVATHVGSRMEFDLVDDLSLATVYHGHSPHIKKVNVNVRRMKVTVTRKIEWVTEELKLNLEGMV